MFDKGEGWVALACVAAGYLLSRWRSDALDAKCFEKTVVSRKRQKMAHDFPDVPRQRINLPPWTHKPGVAEEHAECPICFEPLHSAPVGVFVDGQGHRVSQHMFNFDAAQNWARESELCPVTRRQFRGVLEVPALLTDPRDWFSVVDLDRDGRLSRREVIEVLKAQLPLDITMLDEVPTLNTLTANLVLDFSSNPRWLKRRVVNCGPAGTQTGMAS